MVPIGLERKENLHGTRADPCSTPTFKHLPSDVLNNNNYYYINYNKNYCNCSYHNYSNYYSLLRFDYNMSNPKYPFKTSLSQVKYFVMFVKLIRLIITFSLCVSMLKSSFSL